MSVPAKHTHEKEFPLVGSVKRGRPAGAQRWSGKIFCMSRIFLLPHKRLAARFDIRRLYAVACGQQQQRVMAATVPRHPRAGIGTFQRTRKRKPETQQICSSNNNNNNNNNKNQKPETSRLNSFSVPAYVPIPAAENGIRRGFDRVRSSLQFLARKWVGICERGRDIVVLSLSLSIPFHEDSCWVRQGMLVCRCCPGLFFFPFTSSEDQADRQEGEGGREKPGRSRKGRPSPSSHNQQPAQQRSYALRCATSTTSASIYSTARRQSTEQQ